MDFHLDSLLNLGSITVFSCTQQDGQVFLKLKFLTEFSPCPHCQQPSDEINQNRPVLIRDLPLAGQFVYLQVPRRQFYCNVCQRYFTERLNFVDWERRYTQRYEEYIYNRVQTTTVEQVSREEDLSWDQVQGIFKHKFASKEKRLGRRLNV